MLRLVPFNPSWIAHERIDIKAIYRRPRYVADSYGEMHRELDANGMPTWDLTGALPIKQHTKWSQKGFEYVTLANRESLAVASRTGTLPPGTTFADFDQHQTGGPWNFRKWVEGQSDVVTAEMDALRSDVERFGAEAVETLRRRHDPLFVLPASLRVARQEIVDLVTGQAQNRASVEAAVSQAISRERNSAVIHADQSVDTETTVPRKRGRPRKEQEPVSA